MSLDMSIPGETGDTAVDVRFVLASRLADDGVATKRRSRLSTQAREESQRGSLSRQTASVARGSIERGSVDRGTVNRGSAGMGLLERRSGTQRTEIESSGAAEATQEVPGTLPDTQVRESYEGAGMHDGYGEGVGGYGRGLGDDDDGDDDDDDDDFVEGTPPPEG